MKGSTQNQMIMSRKWNLPLSKKVQVKTSKELTEDSQAEIEVHLLEYNYFRLKQKVSKISLHIYKCDKCDENNHLKSFMRRLPRRMHSRLKSKLDRFEQYDGADNHTKIHVTNMWMPVQLLVILV